jgi:hypothetical protein
LHRRCRSPSNQTLCRLELVLARPVAIPDQRHLLVLQPARLMLRSRATAFSYGLSAGRRCDSSASPRGWIAIFRWRRVATIHVTACVGSGSPKSPLGGRVPSIASRKRDAFWALFPTNHRPTETI